MSEQKHLLQRSERSKKPRATQLQPEAGEVGHDIAAQAPGPDSSKLGQTSGARAQLSQTQLLQLLAAPHANQAELLDGAFSSGHRWVQQSHPSERFQVQSKPGHTGV